VLQCLDQILIQSRREYLALTHEGNFKEAKKRYQEKLLESYFSAIHRTFPGSRQRRESVSLHCSPSLRLRENAPKGFDAVLRHLAQG
jgi:hypothetical protein